MARYLIERDVLGAGQLSRDELRGVSQRSCTVLARLGPRIQWVPSYVTADKLYCVYLARCGGDPRARPAGRLSGQPHHRGDGGHRPHDSGSLRRRRRAVCSCCASQICRCDANAATQAKIAELNQEQRDRGITPQCDINGTLCGAQP